MKEVSCGYRIVVFDDGKRKEMVAKFEISPFNLVYKFF